MELLGEEERAQLEDLAEVLSQLFVLAAHVWRQLHLNQLVELRSTRPGCRPAVQHSQQDQVWHEDPLLRELLGAFVLNRPLRSQRKCTASRLTLLEVVVPSELC